MHYPINRNFLFLSLFIFSLTFIHNSTFAQEKKIKVTCIAFYNLENLYDTIDSPDTDDAEFLPTGPNTWNTEKYMLKLDHMSEVISQIGDEQLKGGPAIIGFSEIENRGVLEDLINTPRLKKSGYAIVHYDSPDLRGVDVALIYKPSVFKVEKSYPVRLTLAGDTAFRSRDQLVVKGLLDGEPLTIIVNHWPSRRGGEARSAPKRAAAANLSRAIADSICNVTPNSKIIVMGDLNDDPIDKSLVKVFKAKGKAENLAPCDFFNPGYKLFKDGIGSLAYRDSWNLFDQTLISAGLINNVNGGWKFAVAKVYNKNYLTQKDGAFKGYPFRTMVGGVFIGGYSDHFPVYVFLTKEVK